ncbi:MAG: C10 family peptidase, partial [Bacteroidota bacterium]
MKILLNYIFISFLVLSISFNKNILSQELTKENISIVVNNFIHDKTYYDNRISKTTALNIRSIEEIKNPTTTKTIGFVVNLERKGFLILSNDTKIKPVIAYSFNHSWDYDTTNNIFLQILKADLNNRIDHIDDIPLEVQRKNENLWNYYLSLNKPSALLEDFQQWPAPGTTTTEGWIETTWNQLEPYNQFCPIDPNTYNRSVVGCGALAVSQIVNYHKYFNNKQFADEDKYETENSLISIDDDSTTLDFPSFNELNRKLDTLQNKYNNNLPLNNRDYAALCFACGIMTINDYSSVETPTASSDLHNAFTEDMLYSSAELLSVSDTFYSILKDNIQNGLPALLSMTRGFEGHAA